MSVESEVARHYTTGSLLDRIRHGLAAAGADPDRPTIDDLKPVDEFHIGGHEATADVLAQLDLGKASEVLDIGSGLGGAARRIAATVGCRVTGIDLTEEFVTTARALTELTGFADRVSFVQGSAFELPFSAASFDAATLFHVGMNLPDKPLLFAEAARVLRPHGVFAVYDVMRVGEGEIAYPTAWAATAATSFVETPAHYRAAADATGFEVVAERSRRPLALAHFAARRAMLARAGGAPPLGLHLVISSGIREKSDNMIANIEAGLIAPIEMICRKSA